jgi:hypothetical protein
MYTHISLIDPIHVIRLVKWVVHLPHFIRELAVVKGRCGSHQILERNLR